MSDRLEKALRTDSVRVSCGNHGEYFVVGLEVLTEHGVTTYAMPPDLARDLSADLILHADHAADPEYRGDA